MLPSCQRLPAPTSHASFTFRYPKNTSNNTTLSKHGTLRLRSTGIYTTSAEELKQVGMNVKGVGLKSQGVGRQRLWSTRDHAPSSHKRLSKRIQSILGAFGVEPPPFVPQLQIENLANHAPKPRTHIQGRLRWKGIINPAFQEVSRPPQLKQGKPKSRQILFNVRLCFIGDLPLLGNNFRGGNARSKEMTNHKPAV